MIKKTLLIVVAMLSAMSVFADGRSDELLKALQQKAAAFGDYRVAFKVTIDGQSMTGTYEVSGQRYHMSTADVEVFCDGKVKYEVNSLDEEVLIDAVDPGDRTILGNPTHMFDFLDGSYTHSYVGKATLKDGEADKIELTGAEGKLNVFLNVKTGLPSRISYFLDNLNTDAVVDVESITPNVRIDPTAFNFDPARYKDFEIIDFR